MQTQTLTVNAPVMRSAGDNPQSGVVRRLNGAYAEVEWRQPDGTKRLATMKRDGLMPFDAQEAMRRTNLRREQNRAARAAYVASDWAPARFGDEGAALAFFETATLAGLCAEWRGNKSGAYVVRVYGVRSHTTQQQLQAMVAEVAA